MEFYHARFILLLEYTVVPVVFYYRVGGFVIFLVLYTVSRREYTVVYTFFLCYACAAPIVEAPLYDKVCYNCYTVSGWLNFRLRTNTYCIGVCTFRYVAM